MNKPASELIALADDPQVVAAAQQAIMKHPFFEGGAALAFGLARTVLKAVAAANQSGSERAGVDALEIARAVRQRAANLASGYPKNDPEHLRWLHHSYGADEVAYQIDEALATPPAQPAPASERYRLSYYGDFTPVTVRGSTSEAPSTHGKPDGSVREALRNLLDYAEQRECSHEATHRGGSIWTICDECGKKWADDRGGFIPYQEPKEITQARAALSPKIAAAEISPGDVVAMKEACKRAVTELDCMYVNDERVPYGGIPADPLSSVWREAIEAAEAAIDRIDVKAETSPGDAEAQPSDHAPSNLLFYGLADAIGLSAKLRFNAGGTIKHEFDRNDIKQLRDVLRPKAEAKSQEPEAVAIKPLEWVDNDSERVGSRAQTILGEYVTWISEDECCYLQLASQFKGHPHGASIDAAKAAAQSDYEQRIRSALIHPTTKPEAPAVSVDAIKAALCCPDGCCEPKACGAGKHPDEIAQATAIAALIAGDR